MREMGHLRVQLRTESGKEDANMEDFIDPGQFIAATKRVAGFEDVKHTHKTPSLVLKLGHSLRKCAKVCHGKTIESGDGEKQKLLSSNAQLVANVRIMA